MGTAEAHFPVVNLHMRKPYTLICGNVATALYYYTTPPPNGNR